MEQEIQIILTLSLPAWIDKKDIERHILKYLKDNVEVLKIEIKEESEIFETEFEKGYQLGFYEGQAIM